jgi:DNA-binding NarL/FixJ family response regulator
MTVRVLLVDDHPVVLGGLETALGSVADVEVVGRAGSVAEARAAMASIEADVALVDMRLPDGFGTSLVADAAAAGGPAIVMLSTYAQAQYVATAIRLGAHGFVLKTAPLDEIVDTIRRVAGGGTAFTAEQLRHGQVGEITLTPRERSILRGVLASRSNDEIAAELAVSRKTVEAYLSRMFERFGVASRVELALRAEREGWLDIEADADGVVLG